jgi:hypothetical protein
MASGQEGGIDDRPDAVRGVHQDQRERRDVVDGDRIEIA